ncbi:alpha/beta fold hydrolase [Psychrobacter sp. AOP22-C1-22]|uniref:alpha/beta fold hydrolase n=1 Tax=unclassified Psychrobacter TaxID=196806 RepID=UPI0017882AC7|nr:alpha/beta hydrolase [Psychrobacter sp. FME6]MBE0407237.1 alpha/beta hydrolase [Psychrobacter sp. FME6]
MEAFTNSISLGGKQARYYDLQQLNSAANTANSQRQPAHFYGGNSFTVGTYTPLLSALATDFDITSLALRGYWYDQPQSRRLTREQDADMLIEFLEKTQDKPVVGIGHSQGATATAIAAALRPELFSQLYLIEPVTFTKKQATLYNLLPRKLLLSREPFKSTLTKQATWPSIYDYYEHLRAQRAYRRISDKHLRIFAEQSLTANNDGDYTLMFAPKQELANYFGAPHIDAALKQLSCPYTLITGKPTLFISHKVRQQWQKFVPDDSIISLTDYGHLLPMEAPELCAQVINEHYQSSKQA